MIAMFCHLSIQVLIQEDEYELLLWFQTRRFGLES